MFLLGLRRLSSSICCFERHEFIFLLTKPDEILCNLFPLFNKMYSPNTCFQFLEEKRRPGIPLEFCFWSKRIQQNMVLMRNNKTILIHLNHLGHRKQSARVEGPTLPNVSARRKLETKETLTPAAPSSSPPVHHSQLPPLQTLYHPSTSQRTWLRDCIQRPRAHPYPPPSSNARTRTSPSTRCCNI